MVLVEEWRHLSTLKPLERPVPAVAARDAWSTLFARKQPCGGYATATQVTASVWNPSIQGDAQVSSFQQNVREIFTSPSPPSPPLPSPYAGKLVDLFSGPSGATHTYTIRVLKASTMSKVPSMGSACPRGCSLFCRHYHLSIRVRIPLPGPWSFQDRDHPNQPRH